MGKTLSYHGKSYTLEEGESVLDCLLREGVSLPHACKAGVCQSCLLQGVPGTIPHGAQAGLKETLRQNGFFLACQCVPTHNMDVNDPDATGLDIHARVLEKTYLNHNVIQLRLRPETPFFFRPGQYLTLMNAEGTARSYSMANDLERDNFVELHIKILEDGRMGRWLMEAKPGQVVTLRGPFGQCYYTPHDDQSFPIILAGTGTGLAPLLGIVKDALSQGHRGPIHLLHGGRNTQDLYFHERLRDLERHHGNLTYMPCVLEDGTTPQDIKDATLNALPQDKKDVRLFLCGSPTMVNALKTKVFLSGVASKHIFVDAFLPSV